MKTSAPAGPTSVDITVPNGAGTGTPASAKMKLDLAKIGQLTFEAPDFARFPGLRLAYDALRTGNGATTVYNAANEVAVAAFIAQKIRFGAIARLERSVTADRGQEAFGHLRGNLLDMADAISRVTSGRKIGAFCMQHGPGAENAYGGVAQAYSESVPLLVLPLMWWLWRTRGRDPRPGNRTRLRAGVPVLAPQGFRTREPRRGAGAGHTRPRVLLQLRCRGQRVCN